MAALRFEDQFWDFFEGIRWGQSQESSIFLSFFMCLWYFYDPHNLSKRKSESHLFPIHIVLFPGAELVHFLSHVSCLFYNYCSYSSVYALYMNFIVPCLHSYITEVSFCLLRLQIMSKCTVYVPVPKCSDFVAGYAITDTTKCSISQIVMPMFRFQANKYQICSLQSFSVLWV